MAAFLNCCWTCNNFERFPWNCGKKKDFLISYVTVRMVRLQWRIWLNMMLSQIVHFLFFFQLSVTRRKTAISTLQTNPCLTLRHLIYCSTDVRLARIGHCADLIPTEPIFNWAVGGYFCNTLRDCKTQVLPLCCLDASRRLGVLSSTHKWVRRMLMFCGCRRHPGCQTAGVCFR